jgi:hypothetical protein
MDLAHTSLTTRNRSLFPVLCRDGVLGTFLHQICCHLIADSDNFRCTAPANNLAGVGHSHTCEHSKLVVDAFGQKVAWSDYGIVGDCRASTPHMTLRHCLIAVNSSHSQMAFHERTSILCSPLTSSINSSRGCSRTISWSGSRITSKLLTAVSMPKRSLTISIVG